MNLFSFIKTRLTILDVISEYTTLKKAGLYWKSCCPFHHEKTASFTVSPHKEIFYCFGCHMGGDVISFIAKIEHCSQLEAAKHLIDRYGLEVPAEILEHKTATSQEDKKRYFELCAVVAQWAQQNLHNSQEARNYMLKRNITAHSIEEYTLGYFPAGQAAIKNLLNTAQKKGFMAQDLIESKIVIEGKSLYSPFEDRLLFPIRDHLGRICGFGGRVFKSTDDRVKYYNSHEHYYFNKSQLLYGLDKAKKNIQVKNRAFLVEGYTDCIAMAQAGFTNSIATLGTACTAEHLKQIARYTDNLYIIYDGDPAGQKAIMRLTELCWQANIDLYVITLPVQEDPDSFLAKKQNMQELIASATDIFLFFIKSSTDNFESKSLQERISITKKLLEIIKQVPDQLKQDLLLQKMAQLCRIPFDTLKNQMGLPARVKKYRSEEATPIVQTEKIIVTQPSGDVQVTQLEKKLFSAILFNEIKLSSDDEELLNRWLHPELLFFVKKIKNLQNTNNSIQGSALFDMLETTEKEQLSKLIIEAEDDNNPKEHLLLQFYKKQWKLMIHDVKQKIADAPDPHALLSELEQYKKKMLIRGIT